MDQPEGVRVSIYDHVYHLKSASDRAYMEEIARYVDHQMHAIAAKARTVDSFRVAVLAALHIADELFRLRQEHEKLRSSVEAKSAAYAALLEQALRRADAPASAGTSD